MPSIQFLLLHFPLACLVGCYSHTLLRHFIHSKVSSLATHSHELFKAMMASLVTIDIRGLSLTIQAMACGRMLTSMSMNGCMQFSGPLKYVIMILRRAALLSLNSLYFISMRYNSSSDTVGSNTCP